MDPVPTLVELADGSVVDLPTATYMDVDQLLSSWSPDGALGKRLDYLVGSVQGVEYLVDSVQVLDSRLRTIEDTQERQAFLLATVSVVTAVASVGGYFAYRSAVTDREQIRFQMKYLQDLVHAHDGKMSEGVMHMAKLCSSAKRA